jgi:hypothetical protein
MRYLFTLAASMLLSFGAIWLWVAAVPMAFMDPEYPAWVAKETLLQRCDLGELVVLGDSRAAADIQPARLRSRTTNLAVGGGEAIEALAALRRVLACRNRPKQVILSLDAGHFVRPDLFWERSVRYGFISAAEIAELGAASEVTGDHSVYRARGAGGLPPAVRDWMYWVRFPSFYFASLAHGGGALRWWRNQTTLRNTLASRGHYAFGTGSGSTAVAFDGHLTSFEPLPILDHYFRQLLAELDRLGIETRFVAMPVNDATWGQVRPAMLAGFAAYLANYERRYSHFHVDGDLMPHWPDRFFGDEFCHLNPAGAEKFSTELDQRLQDAPPKTQNEAQNGWLSDTGAEASAKVVPISNRGS